MRAEVSPHAFEPLRWWRNRGRCRACLLPQGAHPTRAWAPARALGDARLPVPCDHDWLYFEDGENYTGYLERCTKCGSIIQIPQ